MRKTIFQTLNPYLSSKVASVIGKENFNNYHTDSPRVRISLKFLRNFAKSYSIII